MTGGLVALVVVPILGIAILWPLTSSVDSAGRLVRAHLASNHAVELAALPQPDRVGQALIATEDSRFFQTPGIDPISAVRAGFAALTGSIDAGGATLEQQLAKNLYFPQNNGVWGKAAWLASADEHGGNNVWHLHVGQIVEVSTICGWRDDVRAAQLWEDTP